MSNQLRLGPVGNVFSFVDDLEEAVAWYAARLHRDPVTRDHRLVAFDIDGVRLTLHIVDDYNAVGPSGPAVYWNVDDVDAFVAEWSAHGARAHRGPKTVFTGERLCQIMDPFGNLFAVRQAASAR